MRLVQATWCYSWWQAAHISHNMYALGMADRFRIRSRGDGRGGRVWLLEAFVK